MAFCVTRTWTWTRTYTVIIRLRGAKGLDGGKRERVLWFAAFVVTKCISRSKFSSALPIIDKPVQTNNNNNRNQLTVSKNNNNNDYNKRESALTRRQNNTTTIQIWMCTSVLTLNSNSNFSFGFGFGYGFNCIWRPCVPFGACRGCCTQCNWPVRLCGRLDSRAIYKKNMEICKSFWCIKQKAQREQLVSLRNGQRKSQRLCQIQVLNTI